MITFGHAAIEGTKTKLVLKDSQKIWANRILYILTNPDLIYYSLSPNVIKGPSLSYIDVSEPGTGKTIVTIDTAMKLGLKLFVVCPLTVTNVWNDKVKYYGADKAEIIGYESLTVGNEGRKWLNSQKKAKQTKNASSKEKTIFLPTQAFDDICKEGILFVLDEFQFVKNEDSLRANAATTLASHIYQLYAYNNYQGRSRIALLSGSPFDDGKFAETTMQILNFLPQHVPAYTYNPGTKEYGSPGLLKIIQQASLYNWNKLKNVLDDYGIGYYGNSLTLQREALNKYIYKLMFDIFKQIIKPTIVGAMKRDPVPYGDVRINAFYPLSAEKQNEFYQIINKAKSDLENEDEKVSNVMLTLVKHLECVKTQLFVQIALRELMEGRKVIIAVWHLETIDKLREKLEKYDPLVLDGRLNKNYRQSIIDDFNTNLSKKLLIMNIQVGGVGISLHDNVGNAPRTMIISPSFKMIDIYQAVYRIIRADVKSDTKVIIAYARVTGDQSFLEKNILTAITRKSGVINEVIETDGINIILPNNYEEIQYN
jgi:hypothetical protein